MMCNTIGKLCDIDQTIPHPWWDVRKIPALTLTSSGRDFSDIPPRMGDCLVNVTQFSFYYTPKLLNKCEKQPVSST